MSQNQEIRYYYSDDDGTYDIIYGMLDRISLSLRQPAIKPNKYGISFV